MGVIAMNTVKFIKLNENAIVPSYGSECAAGADLYACNAGKDIEIKSGETVIIHTGIAMEIPDGYAGMIFARSGIALKRGLAPANKVGVIDSDYRGEIGVILYNIGKRSVYIQKGERIAQGVIVPIMRACFEQVKEVKTTERGRKGYGSTGKR